MTWRLRRRKGTKSVKVETRRERTTKTDSHLVLAVDEHAHLWNPNSRSASSCILCLAGRLTSENIVASCVEQSKSEKVSSALATPTSSAFLSLTSSSVRSIFLISSCLSWTALKAPRASECLAPLLKKERKTSKRVSSSSLLAPRKRQDSPEQSLREDLSLYPSIESLSNLVVGSIRLDDSKLPARRRAVS